MSTDVVGDSNELSDLRQAVQALSADVQRLVAQLSSLHDLQVKHRQLDEKVTETEIQITDVKTRSRKYAIRSAVIALGVFAVIQIVVGLLLLNHVDDLIDQVERDRRNAEADRLVSAYETCLSRNRTTELQVVRERELAELYKTDRPAEARIHGRSADALESSKRECRRPPG